MTPSNYRFLQILMVVVACSSVVEFFHPNTLGCQVCELYPELLVGGPVSSAAAKTEEAKLLQGKQNKTGT